MKITSIIPIAILYFAFSDSIFAQSSSNTEAVAEKPPSVNLLIPGYLIDDKHVLEAGDQISFQILEDKKPATNLTVADSLELSVPYVGRLSVAGQTCRQLAAKVKPLLEKDYYYQATVVIGLNSVNKVKGHVLVWGEVKNQGAVDILANHTLTVGEAILHVGGLTDDADKKKVKVVRHVGPGPAREFEINMADVMDNGKVDMDMVLQPGDYVVVPSRLIRF